MKRKLKPAKERFWAFVRFELNGCWIWTGATDKNGYGVFGINKEKSNIGAHVYAWELQHGPVPIGLCVLHSCDHPPCVRDSHLFLGTQADNVADRVRKNRSAHGEDSGQAVLTEDEVLDMRQKFVFEKGIYARLGREFGIEPEAVSSIVHGKTWKHLPMIHPQPLKGTLAHKGETNGNSKLTEAKVKDILLALKKREITQYELAKQFGISQGTVEAIAARKTWKHVPMP